MNVSGAFISCESSLRRCAFKGDPLRITHSFFPRPPQHRPVLWNLAGTRRRPSFSRLLLLFQESNRLYQKHPTRKKAAFGEPIIDRSDLSLTGIGDPNHIRLELSA